MSVPNYFNDTGFSCMESVTPVTSKFPGYEVTSKDSVFRLDPAAATRSLLPLPAAFLEPQDAARSAIHFDGHPRGPVFRPEYRARQNDVRKPGILPAPQPQSGRLRRFLVEFRGYGRHADECVHYL